MASIAEMLEERKVRFDALSEHDRESFWAYVFGALSDEQFDRVMDHVARFSITPKQVAS